MMQLTHGVRTVVNRLLHSRRLHSRSSGGLYPAPCTFASSLVVALIAGLGPAAGAESEPLPSSVLILNQTRAGLPWFAAFSATFESVLNAGPVNRFSVYSENLDLNRFPGTQHQEVLRTYLQNKYRDTPIGVLVAQGSAALEFVMRSRAELWPAVPVIFAAVDEETAARLNLPSDVTGTIYHVPFDTMVAAAQALVPNLKRMALVGDPWERQAFRRLALRILDGEAASKIPVVRGDFTRPVFDWRQLQRFGISESRLPAGSEVRFREFGLWEQYRWYMAAIFFFVVLQAALIGWLLFEHHRRRIVEMKLRARLSEVIHLNRTATAGALSASVAHELNQPLAAIQSYAEAATLYLEADPPDIERVEQILANIRRDDQRAADIISHLRGLLKKRDELELQECDFNKTVRDTLQILRPEALKRGIALDAYEAKSPLPVRADPIHLQQVILNLAVNGMDAMQDCAPGGGKMSIQTALTDESAIEVRVADSGMGIPTDRLNTIFDAFYTTKRDGTGLGLSIARAIVETHGGKIWAENRPGGGAVFCFTLPSSRMLAA